MLEEANPIDLAIVDDHRALRQAFKIALNNYDFINVLFEAKDGTDLISKLSHFTPDVILLDNKMPNMDGLTALRIVHNKFPNIGIIMFSAYIDEIYVGECLQFGINAFLSKDSDISEIIRAIRLASNNEVYFSNLLSNARIKAYLNKHSKRISPLLPDFSKEELGIMELMLHEKGTSEIANTMHMSRRSIELKRNKMKEKANVASNMGLLLYCLKRGLIDE
jgi:DNA-binding NarL/FixJ family response regulator